MFAGIRAGIAIVCAVMVLVAALAALPTVLHAQSAVSVTVTPSTVTPGGTITVDVANGPGNALDWVGLFPAGALDTESLAWKYLNGLQTVPASATSIATLTFALPAAPGTYNVRFFENNSFTKLATSATVTAQPSLTVTPTTASPGGLITVTMANGPGNATDWVALYPTGAGDGGYLTWQYLNGLQSVPATGQTAATLTFALPAAPGNYDLRFFANNSFTRLTTSAPVTTQSGLAATVAATPLTASPGGTITVTVANGPGNARDWVGLFRAGALDTEAFFSWKYLNGLQTVPASGTSTATLTFALPAAPGTYNVRFFANDSFTKLATSATVTAQPSLTVTPTTASPGGLITVTMANGPGNATDWVGLYPTGAGDGSYLAWQYLNGTLSVPASGVSAATLTFTLPAAPGTYDVRFFVNNSLTKVATSGTIAAMPSLTVTPTIAGPGGTITVTVANGPGNATDWVALYPTGAGDGSYLAWQYLNGALSVPTSGASAATLTFALPAAPGTYNVRFFENNSFSKLATSVTITVSTDSTAPVISAVTVTFLTSTVATIAWSTDEVSNSEIEYGPTTAYGGFSTLDINLATAHSMSINELAPGTLYHFRVRSRDVAGNLALSGDSTFTTLDGTLPSVSITEPAAGAEVTGIITVRATATDSQGILGVEFQVDGEPIGLPDFEAPYSVVWDTTTATDGSRTLTAVARDTAENQATSAPVTVTVANTAQVTLAWDPNTEPDLAGYNLYIGTSTGIYPVTIDVGDVTSYTVSLLKGTLYYFAVTAYNEFGAESDFSNEVTEVP